MRDDRGRRVTITRVDHDLDAVRREHLQCAGKSGRRERVRIDPEVKRSVDPLFPAVETDGLGDCENVGLVEGVFE